MNRVSTNMEPTIAKNAKVMARFAALNRGILKKRTSSIGWSVAICHQTGFPMFWREKWLLADQNSLQN